jgi:hypothetical protein
MHIVNYIVCCGFNRLKVIPLQTCHIQSIKFYQMYMYIFVYLLFYVRSGMFHAYVDVSIAGEGL